MRESPCWVIRVSAAARPSRGLLGFQASRLLLLLGFLRSPAQQPAALGRPSSLEGPHWPSKGATSGLQPRGLGHFGRELPPEPQQGPLQVPGQGQSRSAQGWRSKGRGAAQESFLEEVMTRKDSKEKRRRQA